MEKAYFDLRRSELHCAPQNLAESPLLWARCLASQKRNQTPEDSALKKEFENRPKVKLPETHKPTIPNFPFQTNSSKKNSSKTNMSDKEKGTSMLSTWKYSKKKAG